MAFRDVYSPEARKDLFEIYDYLAEVASPHRALAYVERITAHCLALSDFPERGTRQDELRPGLRTVGFERRVTIGFHVGVDVVTIDRVLYGGRDLGGAF